MGALHQDRLADWPLDSTRLDSESISRKWVRGHSWFIREAEFSDS
jgi:hypothetical protein